MQRDFHHGLLGHPRQQQGLAHDERRHVGQRRHVTELEQRVLEPAGLDCDGHSGHALVTFTSYSGYSFEEAHLYVGSEMLPRDKNGGYTVAPRQYPEIKDDLDSATSVTFLVSGVSGDVYVVAHAVAAGTFQTRSDLSGERPDTRALPVSSGRGSCADGRRTARQHAGPGCTLPAPETASARARCTFARQDEP